ncbi:hypothetical protein L581_2093 [Serratia fonticola AU-AP2C]|nr:hypothetical protein L581_2093 [Serratia fonticola AU-AP2C]
MCRTTDTITERFSLSFCSVAFTKIESQKLLLKRGSCATGQEPGCH